MEHAKKCEMSKCPNVELIRCNHESTWTTEKFYCPNCGRIYLIPTTAGKLAQVSPLAMLGGFALAVMTHAQDVLSHAGDVIDHASDAFDDLLS